RLARLLAQRLPQRRVDDVRRRVASLGRGAPREIDARQRRRPGLHLAARDRGRMHDELAEPPLRVRDFEARAVDLDDAVVPDLAASLRVERGRIQDDFDLVAFPCRGDLLAGAHDSDELRFLLRSLVAGEEARAGLGEDARQRLAIRQVQLRAPVAAGTRTLLAHQYLEVGAVDLEARVLRDLERQLER